MNIDEIPLDEYLNHYTMQEISGIGKKLVPILLKYDKNLVFPEASRRLYDQPVEFLKVLLSITTHYELNYRPSNNRYATHKPAAILQLLKDELVKMSDRHIDISFKFPRKRFTVEDRIVSAWIREKLIQCFDAFDISADFGEAMFLLDARDNPIQDINNTELLKSYAKRPATFAKVVYSFCRSVIDYLKLTVELAPHDAQLYSEQQLSFLYELLELMAFEGFEDTFGADFKPAATDIDKLYQILNYQHRLKR